QRKMPTLSGKADVLFEDDDLPYEEEIIRNPYSVKCWMRYIEHKQNAQKSVLNMIYERALKELPGSYKLWYNYLRERRKQVKGKCVTDPAYEEVNNCHERALVFMHKMPRIWIDYCQLMVSQCKITRSRRTFDRALRALPITQHPRIWPLYLRFARNLPLPETAIRVYRRYLKLSPENAEEYIDYLRSVGRLDEAAIRLAAVVNDENFVSKEGKSNYQLWHELCDLISQNPDKVTSLKVGAIIRGGLTRFTDQLGKLWCSLADYYIRSGHFEKARDVYEEAILTVVTVRDFTQVFDSFAQFEESMIAAKMENTSELGQDEEDDIDLELRLARFESLITRRPLLLNSVLLRQNPHNVHEWHKRVKLYEGQPRQIINTYTEAVQTIDSMKATGKPHSLWVSFARFYEDNEQLDDARTIFEKATKVNYKQVDDLAAVWCEYGEMELRHENYDQALRILRVRDYYTLPLIDMCLRFADMESKLGEIDRARAIYSYCSQICDPRVTAHFWQTWKEFEVRHGNEDTIREMLRIKRINFMSSQMLKATTNATGTVSDLAPGESGVDDMKLLEQKAQQLAAEAEQDKPKPKDKILFVRSDTSRSELAELAKQANPDEIDIDDDEDEDAEDGEPDEVQLEQKSVPTAVFGGLKDD
uniref:XPA binding protein 2 n=1 Tax=Sinocyclocheilus grahami TaxID=75366 RepID=A0A672MV74_SINGR